MTIVFIDLFGGRPPKLVVAQLVDGPYDGSTTTAPAYLPPVLQVGTCGRCTDLHGWDVQPGDQWTIDKPDDLAAYALDDREKIIYRYAPLTDDAPPQSTDKREPVLA